MSVWVPAVLKGMWDLGSQYFTNKKEQKQVEHQQKLKLIEQDSTLIAQGNDSWKDEYWTLILSFPFIQLMLAPVVELGMSPDPYQVGQWTNAVIQGLEAIKLAPKEYLYAVGISVSYSFGIKPAASSIGQFLKK